MSPEDIKLNYFFDEPVETDIKMSKYLEYSEKDGLYLEVKEEDETQGYVRDKYIFGEDDASEANIEAETYQDSEADIDSKWDFALEENYINDVYNMEGNNRTDAEYSVEN